MYKFTLLTFSLLAFAPALTWGATGAHTWADSSVLSEGYWVKVSLDEGKDGIYQITYSQLRNWGFSNPSQVGVYGYGGHVLTESFAEGHTDDLPEVAVLHDSSHERIVFYGQGLTEWTRSGDTYSHRTHPYATKAYYFLHQKESGTAPLGLDTLASNPTVPADTLTDYDECWLHEVDYVNLGETGRAWYGESFLTTQTQSFALPEESWLSGHTFKAGTARLSVTMAAHATSTSTFAVRVGSENVGSKTIAATSNSYAFGAEATYSGSLTDMAALKGAQVRITYTPGSASPSVARLDYIRMQGKCSLEASKSEPFLLFRNAKASSAGDVAYKIAGLDKNMQIWDVTSPLAPKVQSLEAEVGASGTGVFIPTTAGVNEYAVVNLAGTFLTVSRAGTVSNQNLHAQQPVNLVVLAPSGLKSYAQQLADYRMEHDSLTSVVVTPEQVYNEYSSGVPDVTAVRLFLKQLYDRGKGDSGDLMYLLLFGDGSYDNRTASESNTMLLTYQTEASLVETSSCVSDDYFGFLDDDEGGKKDASGRYSISSDRLDIGIGRLPVSTTSDAANVLAKILRYDSESQMGSWKNRLCFLSDDDKMDNSGTDSPNLHMKHNDQLIKSLLDDGHYEYMYQKIYLAAYQQSSSTSGTDYPDARKDLNRALQQGCLLMNYAGHGSSQNITHEMLMSVSSASQLNMKHLPVWITASCDVSRYDGKNESLGEALLLNPNGGAAALVSTTRVVYASQNLRLNQAMIDHLFDRHADGTRYRLGDILRVAKTSLGSDYNKLNFCLMGDPSMTLAFPEHEMVVDSIGGNFEALSQVTVAGHVLKTGSSEIDTTFNGLVYPTVYDAEDSLTADKGIYQEPVYTFTSRTRKAFAGRDLVRGGKFRFTFTVPQDISYSDGSGLLNLYACSEDGAEAQGYYNDFVLKAGHTSADADTVPPVIIACFLDKETFRSGDKVGLTPYFCAEVSDSSGINATGNGIGHDISLYVECLSNPLVANRHYVLNDYFTTYTGNAGHGNVRYSLDDLSEGRYKATFRVWDVYNNFSTRSFEFTVSGANRPEIALLQAYPSPVRQGETVTFRVLHNRPESADQLRLQVYTQTGVKVLDTSASSSSANVVYLQDGATSPSQLNDDLNADETSHLMGASTITWTASVAPGVYVYKAYLSAGSDEATTQSKILMVY